MDDSTNIDLATTIPVEWRGMRVDQALAKCFPDYSRSKLTQWLKAGYVRIDGVSLPPKVRLQGDESIVIQTVLESSQEAKPEAIPLNIIFEDDSVLVINKPAGLVVHPGAGNHQGTLLNALLHHRPQQALLPRAGILHRLDKDTTGLMVVAKTLPAHTVLVADLAERTIKREYLALVAGEILAGKTIRQPIGRHRTQRIKMAVTNAGKPAVTQTRCHTRFKGYTLLQVTLETGRTHQIRVHLSHDGYPLVGDSAYGWRYTVPKGATPELHEAIRQFKRQALHAFRLGFLHPIDKTPLSFEAPLPEDLQKLIVILGTTQ